MVKHLPQLEHVIYDCWCQLAPVLRSATDTTSKKLKGKMFNVRRADFRPRVTLEGHEEEHRIRLRNLTGVLDRGHGPTHAELRCHLEYSANAHSWCFREVELRVESVKGYWRRPQWSPA